MWELGRGDTSLPESKCPAENEEEDELEHPVITPSRPLSVLSVQEAEVRLADCKNNVRGLFNTFDGIFLDKRGCDACGAGGARLVCPCHTVRYCSKERQTKVFKDHKKKCTNWLLKEVEIREEKKLRRVMQHDEDANEWDEYQM